MANILNLITIGDVWAISSDIDPSLSGGVDAPIGSFGGAIDGSGTFYKSGALLTDWDKLISSADFASTSTDGILSSTDWNTFDNKIGGSGTLNQYAKFTASGVIGNSIFSDDGTDATSTGILYFANNKGIDVVVTGGVDVLNIGTSNADIINIGWSGANVNIMGNTFYENVTELQVKDKLFTVNKGGAVASGVSSGFEIEEGGVITGQFSTNGTRDGWSFLAPAIASSATLLLSSLTANRTLTIQDANGTLAYLSDITTSQITGILSIAKGGTNSSAVLSNNRLMVSIGGAVVEHSAQTLNRIFISDSVTGLPSTTNNLRWDNTNGALGIGGASSPTQRVTITQVGAFGRGLFISSAYQTFLASTTSSVESTLYLENSSGFVGVNDISIFVKAGGTATIGNGLFQAWSLQVPIGTVVNKFGVVTTDITAGTYKTKFVWQTPNEINGTIIDRMSLSSRGVLELYHPVGTIYNEGFLSGSTNDSNNVTATAVETNFTTNSSTFVVPANSLQVGSRIRVSFKGRFSTPAVAQTLTFRFKTGATVLLATAARTMVLSAINRGLTGDVIMRVDSIGVAGTVMAGMTILYQETNAFSDGYLTPNITDKTFNTTIANTLQFSAQWSTANAGNSIILEDVYFEILKPQ